MTKEFDERNMAKSRRVCEAMAEAASTGKRVLTERERAILDMWPRFENGEYVWFGDRYEDWDGLKKEVAAVQFERDERSLLDRDGFHTCFSFGERVKRPVQSVLDADGVEIKVGDTVWYWGLYGRDFTYKATVAGFCEYSLGLDGPLATLKDEAGRTWHIDPKKITHVQPDSWERLEEDAEFNDETGIVGGNLDIVRRAKALAGVEVDE